MKHVAIVFISLFLSCSLFAQEDSLASKEPYRHFIMPTAKPIQGGYTGVWELAFLNAGYGLWDFLSFSGGITLMPTVSMKSQIGYLQAKATFADEEGISFAAGVNYLRMTSEYPYIHGFISATAEHQDETRYTGFIFYKFYGEEYPIVDIYPYGSFSFAYTGSLGAGIGFDKPIKAWKNIRFVAEAWNHDLTNIKNLAILGALRLETTNFSSDFGLMYFSVPILVPVASFVARF
jgi:hypothetical protein